MDNPFVITGIVFGSYAFLGAICVFVATYRTYRQGKDIESEDLVAWAVAGPLAIAGGLMFFLIAMPFALVAGLAEWLGKKRR